MEYKTSLSYSGLQRDAFIEQLMLSLNNTEKSVMELEMYKPLLNMTEEQREKFVEYVNDGNNVFRGSRICYP